MRQPADLLRSCLLGLLLLIAFNFAQAGEADVRRTWQLLDYIAVDYRGAVKDGAIASATEYAEMREFAQTSRVKLASLETKPEQASLLRGADELLTAIDAKADGAKVALLAKGLASHLLAAYPIPSSPAQAPDLAAAATLYKAQCAACHGLTGKGDGPLGLRLNPPPVAFTDQERAQQRSTFALYQVISQGLEGTSMPSFATLSDGDRWALAFYIGRFPHDSSQVASGKKLWKESPALRNEIMGLETLARLTQEDLAKTMGDAPARAVLAYLRSHPDAVLQNRSLNFDVARDRLARSAAAYGRREYAQATELALSAYLDGVEPLEPIIAARDRSLMARIEAAMSQYRSLVSQRAPSAELQAQVTTIEGLFRDADGALASSSDATAAFLASLTILLREGLEALLVVVAMLAFLRKAERPDMLRYVHAGWTSALVLGAVTWGVATYLVNVSGASREVTEGVSSLFAAVVLLSVGMWMHQKSMAGAWQKYIHEKLSSALSRKSAIFLAGLAFIAVYREVFETVLFYAALWEQGNHEALAAGLLAGLALLAAVGFAMLRFSVRLPIGKFFSWSSALVAVLAVVLTGKGIAGLQEAGWIESHATATPRIEMLGVYPSAQVLLAQLSMVVLVAAGFIWNARSARVKSER